MQPFLLGVADFGLFPLPACQFNENCGILVSLWVLISVQMKWTTRLGVMGECNGQANRENAGVPLLRSVVSSDQEYVLLNVVDTLQHKILS